jgi:hypothetical protein
VFILTGEWWPPLRFYWCRLAWLTGLYCSACMHTFTNVCQGTPDFQTGEVRGGAQKGWHAVQPKGSPILYTINSHVRTCTRCASWRPLVRAHTTSGWLLLYTSTMVWWQVSEVCPCTDKSSMPKPGQGATLHVTATYTLRYKNKCLCFICIYKRAKICIDIYLILDKSPAPLLRNVGNTCMLMLPWEENDM